MQLPQLTFTRFIAAVSVVVFHYGLNAFPFENGFLHSLFSEGSICVSYFFFLSGFVLTISNGSPVSPISPKHFWIKRFTRIYPLYLAAFVITLVSAMVLKGSFPRGNSIILQLLSIHAWKPGIALEINFPAWSLAVEIFFYALFPFLLFMLNKTGRRNFILIAMLVWMLAAAQHVLAKTGAGGSGAAYEQLLLYFPLWHLNTFMMGIAGAIIFFSIPKNKNKSLLPATIAMASAAAIVIILSTGNIVRPFVHNGLLSPLFMLFVIGLSLDNTLLKRPLSNKWLVWLGDISFEIYILQFPVYLWIEFVLIKAGVPIHNTIGFFLYLAVLVFTSALAHRFIGRPVREALNRRWLVRGLKHSVTNAQ